MSQVAETSAESVDKPFWKRILVQPMVGLVASAVAVALVADAWLLSTPDLTRAAALGDIIAPAAALVLWLYLSYQFPIHIRYTVKIFMGSVPLFLIAALLPPPVAALAAGVGVVLGEWSVRGSRDLYPSDVATHGARYTIVILGASLVAHLHIVGLPAVPVHMGLLAAAALVMLVGDYLTLPLAAVPITGEHPWHIVRECALGSGWPEAGQYFLGLMGAFLALQDIWASTLVALPIALLYHTSKRAKEMHENTRLLLENMADSVDSRDAFTHNHSVRVTEWTRALLRELNVVGPEAQLIITAARVHDIGKMSLPDELIHKHEKLTEDEWKMMETHPVIGAQLLERYPAFARGAAIVRGHHERYDGKGYPDRLAGTEIPFGARMLAVVDSFDAMTSDRPYRSGMSIERAAAILLGGGGTQWDPAIVEAFMRVLADQLSDSVPQAQADAAHLPTMV